MKSVQFFIVLSILLMSFSSPHEGPVSISFNANPSGKERIKVLNHSYEVELLEYINQYRIENGLESLRISKSLMQASRYHAADMANENYFEHATHNRNSQSLQRGISTFKRIGRFYDGFANTENIGAGYISPQSVFEGWVNSPGHKKNLLNKSATHMGVGYYHNASSKYRNYWVFESAAQ
tara:strand:- start:10423 stop:10962 length:540 start_codon:yes stop_codon:yes gene_type:complete